ncbi:uncharacterized protein GGS25DRAFT_494753 [Hypoxylon fragiforme]|uniref:uncharacterized protein n=1 Tax=Hypoxylon fragiforme TaxID=63214 RepID=UPI0020C6D7DF|nr:uncharacterized protein GGS25DRAFT_494753 [Hypoxylon fragiforme]KAI2607200.1 hypothetical protein GGS25DRAFT_494753 [Hypoxylon fragiforme]
MAVHYPLNGIDLDFRRYNYRPIGVRDIMANQIMEDCMKPRRVQPEIYTRVLNLHRPFHEIKSRDRTIGLHLQLLSKLVDTQPNWTFDAVHARVNINSRISVFEPAFLMVPGLDEEYITVEDYLLYLIERHLLESQPSMRTLVKALRYIRLKASLGPEPSLKKDLHQHLKSFQALSIKDPRLCVYSKRHYLPINGSSAVRFCIDPCFIGTPWINPVTMRLCPNRDWDLLLTLRRTPYGRKKNLHAVSLHDRAYSNTPSRSRSTPAPKDWGTAVILGLDRFDPTEKRLLYFPRPRLSELDKKTRRRSLSRTHIRAMFSDVPERTITARRLRKGPRSTKHPCANCAQYTHLTKHCVLNCGYCNSPDHQATVCAVQSKNRCKCRPFPQFHTAAECYVRCSRRCGYPNTTTRHFYHKNAMLCTYRCCMCGIRHHSGNQCALKRCPCGLQHLTQDCRWKVECPAQGCDFYLCHLHCRECGTQKNKETKSLFVGRTCPDCLRNGKPVSAKAE